MEKHRYKPAWELGRAAKLCVPGSISAMPKHLWKSRVWLRGKKILMTRNASAASRKKKKKEADSGLHDDGKGGGGPGAQRGRARPYSHARVKGHGNTKHGPGKPQLRPGKPQPRFPRCHEGTMSVKAQFKSCMGLSLPLPEPGGDSPCFPPGMQRPLVALPGISLHSEPRHPHGQPMGGGTHG